MPVDPALGLRSLGTLARVLSTPTALLSLLEAGAEGALLALGAASVSVGRLEHGGGLVRALVNVGDLPVTEDRFPEDEASADVFAIPEGASRVVTTVAVDINGLKQVNDQCGHARGDELLEAVGGSLHQAFASMTGSLVARVGGDEFIVLVPDQDPDLVASAVQALCRVVGEAWSGGPVAGVSAGVASALILGRADATRSDLLIAADRALCVAKQLGSPPVVVSTELTAPCL